MSQPFRRFLRLALTKELLLDFEDRLRAEAAKAFEMVRERSGLNTKRARELEGQARFRMMEQGFEEVCRLHNGALLEGGVVAASKLRIFQPFMRFEVEGRGLILGLAAIPGKKELPPKNKSRGAGVSLNYHLSPRLDLDDASPKMGDVFGLLLVSRNKEKAGLISEIAVGVIDSGYSAFLFYEGLEELVSGAAATPVAIAPETPVKKKPAVKLKKAVAPFIPPEAPPLSEKGKKEPS